LSRKDRRSPLAAAAGLGSARYGSGAWWAQRVTAIALLPLSLWFAGEIIAHTGSDYGAFVDWIRTPLTSSLMILLLIGLFYHTALGLQVVLEDYVHSGIKFAAIIGIRVTCLVLAVVGVLSVLRVVFGG
jgi:succinate dehydrogenase / fumarate reductase membrane anchor subunit